ncbi:DUF4430 domain-containing protein [Xylanimonas allomyrinae]|uniref:DUF4430 domain-containing protein n=1 Tax=Xylanimonas allomyrinae TaxID=2509459 RepID=UPI0013A620A9|nr:DUF4430 domain-containing protein [Xylanimonas allomyrinae]
MKTRALLTRALALPTAGVLALGLPAGCSGDGAGIDEPAPGQTSASDGTGLTTSADGTEVSYQGVAGKTALEWLLALDPQAFADGEGANAFVTTIGGRASDQSKNEFWAFYVNGEQAQVGAGSYVMKDGDEITWKLETY